MKHGFDGFTDLASRSGAARIRAKAEEALSRGEVVELDFTGVDSLSHAYADELFGTLVQQYPDGLAHDRIRIGGACEAVQQQIVDAIRLRMEGSGERETAQQRTAT